MTCTAASHKGAIKERAASLSRTSDTSGLQTDPIIKIYLM